jgi:transcriptional regulator with XRE-family HTH domain
MSKKPEPRTFADNLREAMQAAGVTQEALARAVDVTLSTVSRWYRGRNKPDLDKLDRIAEALGTEASELVRK